jgi:undecaprenyl-diphosphatase
MPPILQKIDNTLFLTINTSFTNRGLDQLFLIATEPIYYILPVVLAVLFFLKSNWKRTLVVAALAVTTLALTDTLCDEVLKPFFNRPRPCHPDLMVPGARCIDGVKTSSSFPSAHATNIFAQATLFAFLFPTRSIFFFLFALMIGVSRIYLGFHYPLDVVGGALIGSGIAVGVYAVYRLGRKRYSAAAA